MEENWLPPPPPPPPATVEVTKSDLSAKLHSRILSGTKSWNFGIGRPLSDNNSSDSWSSQARVSGQHSMEEVLVPASQLEDKLTSSGKELLPQCPDSSIDPDCFHRDLSWHVPLYLAALKGDWKSAAAIFAEDRRAMGAVITETYETALHIASGAKRTEFVQKIVKEMNVSQLRMRNFVGNTALCFAAASGIVEIAKEMVDKDRELLFIPGGQGASPLYTATLLGHEEMVWYLYDNTKQYLGFGECAGLLVAAITSDLYDFAVELLRQHPEIGTPNNNTSKHQNGKNETVFHVLARKPQAYYSGHQFSSFKRLIYHSLFVDVQENLLTQTEYSDKSNHIIKGSNYLFL
ncbi:hypothetical protein LIER_22952 [Lithospermum erythrorhizon]|uniref:Uncharacterized protein n=1 Tax=Lithospermum erythrorhizon TaxID=34254 RepID=A0AAV3QX89_LITER